MLHAAKTAEAVLTAGATQPAPAATVADTGDADETASVTTAGEGVDLASLTPQTFLVRPSRPDSNRNRGKNAFKRRPKPAQPATTATPSTASAAPPVPDLGPDAPRDEEEDEIDYEAMVEEMEHLQLSLEEAWFLASAIGVLKIYDPSTVGSRSKWGNVLRGRKHTLSRTPFCRFSFRLIQNAQHRFLDQTIHSSSAMWHTTTSARSDGSSSPVSNSHATGYCTRKALSFRTRREPSPCRSQAKPASADEQLLLRGHPCLFGSERTSSLAIRARRLVCRAVQLEMDEHCNAGQFARTKGVHRVLSWWSQLMTRRSSWYMLQFRALNLSLQRSGCRMAGWIGANSTCASSFHGILCAKRLWSVLCLILGQVD